jgi:integrase
MWNELATEHRAWDVLLKIEHGQLDIGKFYDHWKGAKGDLKQVRRLLEDVNLSTLREEFLKVYDASVTNAETRDRMRRHLDRLFATPLLASETDTRVVSKRLHQAQVSASTKRTIHASWTTFFDYARKVAGVIEKNPMDDIDRPVAKKLPLEFYELDEIQQVVAWQTTPQRGALFALLYGSGVEATVLLKLTRTDFNPATKEFRAAGTKAHTRDRIARVDDWAWGRVWSYVRTLDKGARLFDGITRSAVYFWHEQAVQNGQYEPTGKKGEHRLVKAPLTNIRWIKPYAARHAWAVRHLRAGVPVAVVQHQLGHATAKETLDTYGPFIPDGVDRAHWARQVEAAEARRVGALADTAQSDLFAAG